MAKWSKFLKSFVLLNALSLCISVITVKPQTAVRVSFNKVAKTTSKPRTSNRPTRTRSRPRGKRTVVVKTKEVVREVVRTVKTSNLTVSSEPGAEVSLLASVSEAKPISKNVPTSNPDDKTVEFENLNPGKYTVTVTLDGFETQETEVEIPKQKTVGISMELEPIKYNLSIETNVTDGEIRYAPAEFVGKDADGSIITKEKGGYCIVPIQNGEAVITELQKGYYNIDVRPSAVEYEPILTAINVPTEIVEDNNNNDDDELTYSIELEKKISTETFSSSWANSDWNLPGGWSLSGRQMQTMGLDGVALPRNDQYRHYTNFELVSDVMSVDGKSVGFVIRAVDPKNYYLIQISGANSQEKFIAAGFVVKEGVSTPLFTIPIDHFASTIEKTKPFRVIIKGEENTFKIFIEDSETATRHEVGNMIDRDESFKKGAVGIAGRANSKFTVGTFTVCAKFCL